MNRGKRKTADHGSVPPLRAGEDFTMAVFGASGDLTERKIMPALYIMYLQGLLPAEFRIVAVARRPWNNEEMRERVAQAVSKFSRIAPEEMKLREFLQHVDYYRADLETDPNAYDALRELLGQQDRYPPNRIFYLAVKPEMFPGIIRGLYEGRLITEAGDTNWSRVVIEKPFGHDIDSARELNRHLTRYLDESQVYRIDHYLGKETVQNILSFRFANSIFEPLFNNTIIEEVQITAAETTGMERGRGAYYDHAGALRDMLQNHMLQLMSLFAMEPPARMSAEAIRNEKVKVLQSITPITDITSAEQVVRAQYNAGIVNGETARGFLEENGVGAQSATETFIALRLNIENWRWAGVPFYLRTGKRLARRLTEIRVRFKMPPLQLFQTVRCEGMACDLSQANPNMLIFRVQPDEGITLRISAKRPQIQLAVENVDMDFNYATRWAQELPDAYERLLLDLMRGDGTLFMRSDEVEAAWQVVDPIVKGCSMKTDRPYSYPAGSWGPPEAGLLFHGSGSGWHNQE